MTTLLKKAMTATPARTHIIINSGFTVMSPANEKDEDAAAAVAAADDVGVGATRIFKRKASTQNAAIL